MSRTLMLSLAALATLAVAGSAFGSASRTRLSVRPGHAAPGATIRIVGNAGECSVGATITAISRAFPGHAYGEGSLTGLVRSGHRFAISGRLRRSLRHGRYLVTARCGGGNLGVAAHIRVN